eukprot:2219967-Pyramimonas_sp.AAC.1
MFAPVAFKSVLCSSTIIPECESVESGVHRLGVVPPGPHAILVVDNWLGSYLQEKLVLNIPMARKWLRRTKKGPMLSCVANMNGHACLS